MGPRAAWVSLIGPRRAGKSTLAKELAARLKRPAIDLDAWIEAERGQSIAAIFAAEGEEAFRTFERRALDAVLSGPPGVLATGGGTPIAAQCAARLREAGLVLYLALGLEGQRARLRSDSDPAARPRLLPGSIDSELEALHRFRDPRYREVAHEVIDAEGDWQVVVTLALEAIERFERLR